MAINFLRCRLETLEAAESTSYEKGAESMRERVLVVAEWTGSVHCSCIDREICASCGTVDEMLEAIRALPLKENEG